MLKSPTGTIRIALIGIGNCASSLVQGLQHYRQGANDLTGLLHAEIGVSPGRHPCGGGMGRGPAQGGPRCRRGDLR